MKRKINNFLKVLKNKNDFFKNIKRKYLLIEKRKTQRAIATENLTEEDYLADEEKYKEFAKKYGYTYIESIKELHNNYKNNSSSLPLNKKRLCNEHYMVPLTEIKTNTKVIAIRDIFNIDYGVINNFYFSKIIIFSPVVMEALFGELDEKLSFEEDYGENDEAIEEHINNILEQAVLVNASDIHIETNEKMGTVWFRVDGQKKDKGNMPIKIANVIKRKLAIMANKEDSETATINGIIQEEVAKRMCAFRLCIMNSQESFSAVLRVSTGKVKTKALKELGYGERSQKALQDMTKFYNGLILITGQVGSGKTMLMYTLLDMLNKKGLNIITAEDPVEQQKEEYFQKDLSQFADATEDYKYSFADAIVDMLRQDPDVILIGETREPETARQSIIASNTGHLVFTTMHTNSVEASTPRLKMLGINEGDITDNLRGVVSQRLVESLCADCKEKDEDDKNGGYKKVGCVSCEGKGYKGRVPITEIAVFKIGFGGDMNNTIDYISLDDSANLQYEAGFITKEDCASIKAGEYIEH